MRTSPGRLRTLLIVLLALVPFCSRDALPNGTVALRVGGAPHGDASPQLGAIPRETRLRSSTSRVPSSGVAGTRVGVLLDEPMGSELDAQDESDDPSAVSSGSGTSRRPSFEVVTGAELLIPMAAIASNAPRGPPRA